ncbi:hypothetical protein GCM10009836_25740 [Pseudonocardia ailaonensis]|uniref:VOC domain-containing protein n=1 Tax=Pseudonocardia ailaonensis TaxID=367279 RepID=A0ABN2N207_9PSEU
MSSSGSGPRPASLRPWINRISHIVVNVSDLERAREFWERHTPMRVFGRTRSPVQSFPALGIDRGQFTGYLLRDASDGGVVTPTQNSHNPNYCAVHLVQWLTPEPVGRPYDRASQIGWYRLAFRSERPTRVVYDELVAAGVQPFSPPAEDVTAIAFPDPDGIVLEFVDRRPGAAPASVDRLAHLASSSKDVNETIRFYRDLVGVDHTASVSGPPVTNTFDAYGGKAGYDAAFFAARGDPRLFLDRLSWTGGPENSGIPYESGLHLGFQRLALEVDDIDAAYATLVEQAAQFPGVRVSGPPEEWDFGPDFGGTRRVVVFTDPDGVGHELISAIPYSLALPLPRPLSMPEVVVPGVRE